MTTQAEIAAAIEALEYLLNDSLNYHGTPATNHEKTILTALAQQKPQPEDDVAKAIVLGNEREILNKVFDGAPLNFIDELKKNGRARYVIRRLTALSIIPAAAPKPTEQQWRDIKDAPRDGTQFLVYSSGRVYISRPRIDNHGNNKNTYVACPKKPTHWMPLPAPPSEGEG